MEPLMAADPSVCKTLTELDEFLKSKDIDVVINSYEFRYDVEPFGNSISITVLIEANGIQIPNEPKELVLSSTKQFEDSMQLLTPNFLLED